MTSPEFQFAVELCRWSYQGGNGDAARHQAERVDWTAFVAAAKRHRIEALAWHAIEQLEVRAEEQAARELAGRSSAIVEFNLRAALECEALRARFESAGVPLLFLKGHVVAALAYPKPHLKMNQDIDLLVAPTDIPIAASLLLEAGYRLEIPSPATDRNLADWHSARKESVWARPGFFLDLHSALADSPHLLRGLGVDSPKQTVQVAEGIGLPTLRDEEMFAYLCVHGASSAWFRLKWICDLAAFLHHRSGTNVAGLYHRALELGAGRAPAQALLLADKLFGTLAGSPLKSVIARDASTRLLAEIAWSCLASPRSNTEPTSRRFGTVPIRLSQLLLKPGLSFKVGELRRQISAVVDEAAMRKAKAPDVPPAEARSEEPSSG